MVRPVLAILGTVWLVAGVAAIVLGFAGAEWLVEQLPPLAVEAAAVGGAATAIGLAFVLAAAAHVAVVVGLTRGRRWSLTAGILLCGSASVAMLAIAASAGASAARSPDQAPSLLAAMVAALIAAVAYAVSTAVLLRQSGRMGGSGRIGPS